jgi:mannosyl-oligosaccharide glucosidase
VAAALLDDGIPIFVASYLERFVSIFPVPPSYTSSADHRHKLEHFSKAITANLLGGVGYFYGTSIIDVSLTQEWDQDDNWPGDEEGEPASQGARFAEPMALLTATPSRSSFARGFYWYVILDCLQYHG